MALEKDIFFERMHEQGIALTYDDVRMRTRSGYSEPLPEVLAIDSRFSENVSLRVPFVSAAMDTVTSGDMAIAMAKLGGIGVVHAAMSVEQQRVEVRRVKKDTNGRIETPRTVKVSQTLESVLNYCADKKYKFRTFPVENDDGQFVGMLTGDDFKYPDNLSVTVAEAMTPAERVVSASITTTIEEAYRQMQQRKINTLPLIGYDGKIGGMYLFSDASRIYRDQGHYNVDNNGQLRVAAAVSTGDAALERVDALSKYVDVIVIDTADGDSYFAFQMLDRIKENYADLDVIVGNISDGESARELAVAGANGIKVGQGPGSICTTRRETGIGMPQVTAVYDCAKALGEKYGHIPVCADGGIKDHGDIPIAFAAGAHSVMMGRMLAGTEEAPGDIMVRKDGSRMKVYRGMGSPSALRDNVASRERYNAGNSGIFLAEGVEAQVPFEGSVVDVVGYCVLALRKAMRYVKAPDLDSHRRQTQLFRITNAGLRESHPHDIEVIKQ
ncbi:MAG: IMP dehydrogenase [Candidatus Saccharimonadales bacterium]